MVANSLLWAGGRLTFGHSRRQTAASPFGQRGLSDTASASKNTYTDHYDHLADAERGSGHLARVRARARAREWVELAGEGEGEGDGVVELRWSGR